MSRLSVSNDLRVDAERDLRDIGANKIEVYPLNKVSNVSHTVHKQFYSFSCQLIASVCYLSVHPSFIGSSIIYYFLSTFYNFP